MKLKKRKKAIRHRGSGTHGWGARKKHMGSGHRGGFGMAGTGKMGDQKKSYVIKKFGRYFGRLGITSKSTKKKINNVINVGDIEKRINKLKKDKQGVIDLSKYKILGDGDIKIKVSIKAKEISKSAKEKIEKVGGKVILPEKKVEEKKENKQEEVEKEESE